MSCSFDLKWRHPLSIFVMTPKRIGLIGFDRVTAFHLAGTADAFATVALDDGYGGRIACYDVYILGLTGRSFRSESGLVFTPREPIGSIPPLDTIIIPGGSGLRDRAAECVHGAVDPTRRALP